MSDTRLKITTKIALDIKKAIGTQLSRLAFMPRSIAMDGSATLLADSITGVASEFSRIISNRIRGLVAMDIKRQVLSVWGDVQKWVLSALCR